MSALPPAGEIEADCGEPAGPRAGHAGGSSALCHHERGWLGPQLGVEGVWMFAMPRLRRTTMVMSAADATHREMNWLVER